jgi:hypothetical protein
MNGPTIHTCRNAVPYCLEAESLFRSGLTSTTETNPVSKGAHQVAALPKLFRDTKGIILKEIE